MRRSRTIDNSRMRQCLGDLALPSRPMANLGSRRNEFDSVRHQGWLMGSMENMHRPRRISEFMSLRPYLRFAAGPKVMLRAMRGAE